MDPHLERTVDAHLARWHGVISLGEALSLGMSVDQVKTRLRRQTWARVHLAVYQRAGVVLGQEGKLRAACLAAGSDAVVSHRSAGWLWGFLDTAPEVPSITVPHQDRARIEQVEVHRSRIVERAAERRRTLPVTTPARTLIDLASVVTGPVLDHALDRAVVGRAIRIDRLSRSLGSAHHQQPGVHRLLDSLARRGHVDAPEGSVLESATRRLLVEWGYPPRSAQVLLFAGRYRADFRLTDSVLLEVDGYAFHCSPEQKAYDSHRRNALRSAGWVVIESDWVTVMRRPWVLRAEVERLVGPPWAPGSGPSSAPTQLVTRP